MMTMVMKAVLVGCVWVSVCPVWCVCFSRGAGSASCVDMKPGHLSAHPQHTHIQSAVTVHTSRTVYLPQHTLIVSVRSSRAFMGLLLQARSVPEDRVVGGEFTLNPPGTHTLSCVSTADTITHSDKLLKRNLSFTWRAPAQPSGDMRFYITVVHSYFVYWSRIRSAIVHDGTRRTAGYDAGLQARIISASLMKPTDTQIHTSSDLHILHSTQSPISISPNTLLPQHTHTTQLSITPSQTETVTEDTHKPNNNTTQTSSYQHFNIATYTSATQTHTSSETPPHKPTPSHTGLFKHFHTRSHPHTVLDKHMTAQPTLTHTVPHIHKHTLLQTHKYKITPSTQTHGMTPTHRSMTTYPQRNRVTTARSNTLTSPLTTHTHMDSITTLTTHTPTTHAHPVAASTPHPASHPSPHKQAIAVPSTQDSSLLSSTDTSSSTSSSTLTPISIPTSNSTSLSILTPIPNSVSTLTPISTPHPRPTYTSIPKSTTFSIPTPTSTQTSNLTSVPNSGLIPIPILLPTTIQMPTPASISIPIPTTTSILTLVETSTSIPNLTIIPTSIPILTSITSTSIAIPSQTSTASPIPTSTSTPTQTLTAILTSTIPTHTLPLHTSTPPSSPHPDPSPALQRSLSDPVPPRESRDDSNSHAQKEEGSSKPKLPQWPREPPRAPDGKGVKPELVPRQNASELGLLLVGLSAGLGVAVAVGLRYLQRKHCRRHTAMSLGEQSHGNRGVIHVQECGDLVQVRRIRENSFLLLQAEYNLITAPGS